MKTVGSNAAILADQWIFWKKREIGFPATATLAAIQQPSLANSVQVTFHSNSQLLENLLEHLYR